MVHSFDWLFDWLIDWWFDCLIVWLFDCSNFYSSSVGVKKSSEKYGTKLKPEEVIIWTRKGQEKVEESNEGQAKDYSPEKMLLPREL